MAYVYQHIRKDTNEIFYVGIGDTANHGRAHSSKARNRHWHFITAKIPYEVVILQDEISWEEACNAEIFLIEKLGRKDLGTGLLVNMTSGGDGLHNPSEEIRDKIRKKTKRSLIEKYGEERAKEIIEKHAEKLRGRKRPEHSKLMKERMLNKQNNPMYGKKHTDEFKQSKREEWLLNNPGKNKSKEHLQKISNSLKGKPSPFKGMPSKKFTCPHCGKTGGTIMKRWHFDKCKVRLSDDMIIIDDE